MFQKLHLQFYASRCMTSLIIPLPFVLLNLEKVERNIATFFRTTFFIEHLRWLLLFSEKWHFLNLCMKGLRVLFLWSIGSYDSYCIRHNDEHYLIWYTKKPQAISLTRHHCVANLWYIWTLCIKTTIVSKILTFYRNIARLNSIECWRRMSHISHVVNRYFTNIPLKEKENAWNLC